MLPGPGFCTLHAAFNKSVPCGPDAACPKLVTPVEPDVPVEFLPWLRRVSRLDSMRTVGCRFRVDDLDAQTWTALITMHTARHEIEKRVQQAKDRVRKAESTTPSGDPKAEAALAAARKASGAPPPGGSAFPRSKPMR